MADRWYYAHDKNKIGPHSAQELKDLAASGDILPTDTIWKEGIDKGSLATKVQYLFRAAPANLLSPAETAPPAPSVEAATEGTAITEREERAEAAPLAPAVEPAPGTAKPENATPTEAPDNEGPEVLAENSEEPQAPKPPTRPTPNAHQNPVKKARAIAGKGTIIVGQDGVKVRFRKKCVDCNFVDLSFATLAIRPGLMKAMFFCPKCRKRKQVEMQGFVH